jgi:hypothetical protein
MAILVAAGAQLMCSFGTGPSPLAVIPAGHNVLAPPPLATIVDIVPGTNIVPFKMCTSPTNPAVVAARAPVPCTPAIPAPWKPPSNVLISGVPALDQKATCQCALGGVIAVVSPGQTVAVTVP